MHLLNFAHPITEEQKNKIEHLLDETLTSIENVPVQVETEQPLAPQVLEIIERISFTSQEWQSLPILINPPSLNFVTAVVLAELHGRMGYFPPCLQLRPQKNTIPPRFEVAEIMNLQALREQARKRR